MNDRLIDKPCPGFETKMSDGGRGWSVGLPCGELKQTMSKVRLFNFDNELTGRVCCGGVFEERAQKKKKMELIDWIVSQTLETGSFVYLKLDRFLFPNVVAWRSEKPVREEKQLVENSVDCCSRIG